MIDAGYTAPIVCAAVGVTYRQLDYWARTGLLTPSVRAASGSGTQRIYSRRDVLVLRIARLLGEAGVSFPVIRTVVVHIRDRSVAELEAVTIVSDGATVFECAGDREVLEIVRGGRPVVTVAVGPIAAGLYATLDSDPPAPRLTSYPAGSRAVHRAEEPVAVGSRPRLTVVRRPGPL
jgi:DNA-binding transcriptional MerR regulator